MKTLDDVQVMTILSSDELPAPSEFRQVNDLVNWLTSNSMNQLDPETWARFTVKFWHAFIMTPTVAELEQGIGFICKHAGYTLTDRYPLNAAREYKLLEWDYEWHPEYGRLDAQSTVNATSRGLLVGGLLVGSMGLPGLSDPNEMSVPADVSELKMLPAPADIPIQYSAPMGIPEIASMLNQSERTISRWLKKGQLKYRKTGGKYRLHPEEIPCVSLVEQAVLLENPVKSRQIKPTMANSRLR